ncbi:Rpn family recombination-promoting nuclease/putative transposase [Pannus brasiliensis CCIBt3594]|uniref:Rpn family recombination-promoting nuclease/putative transposase n=1 Tax=Pannus brasiliensis CCIBt3594 TaxID=1427578 RepID=A0AAW9QUS3_9CHRO
MKTDSIFYRLFQTFPRCFFDLLGLASETADHYQFTSVERGNLPDCFDGVFLSSDRNRPIYFLKVQLQIDPKFYTGFLAEVFLYLQRTPLNNDWRGVVIYPRYSLDTGGSVHDVEFLQSGRISRFYLDELGDTGSVGIETLKWIIHSEAIDIKRVKALIQQIRREFPDPILPREILQFLETISIYKLPNSNRREIEAMFSLGDLKETRVYQEALEEGREEGRREEKIDTVRRLSALGLSAEQIALGTGLSIERVRQILSVS